MRDSEARLRARRAHGLLGRLDQRAACGVEDETLPRKFAQIAAPHSRLAKLSKPNLNRNPIATADPRIAKTQHSAAIERPRRTVSKTVSGVRPLTGVRIPPLRLTGSPPGQGPGTAGLRGPAGAVSSPRRRGSLTRASSRPTPALETDRSPSTRALLRGRGPSPVWRRRAIPASGAGAPNSDWGSGGRRAGNASRSRDVGQVAPAGSHHRVGGTLAGLEQDADER